MKNSFNIRRKLQIKIEKIHNINNHIQLFMVEFPNYTDKDFYYRHFEMMRITAKLQLELFNELMNGAANE